MLSTRRVIAQHDVDVRSRLVAAVSGGKAWVGYGQNRPFDLGNAR